MTDPPAPETPAEPEAPDSDQRVRPVIIERRTRSAGRGFIWLIPVAALVVSVWIALDAWSDRGPRIVVEFAEVHGLEAGDVVRCRGVEIGRVDAIEWSALGAGTEATRSIRVVATIRADASDLIRSGARFWIARPEIDYGGIRGLETVVGPRYLALSRGTGDVERGPFVGLRAAPLEWVDRVDDLEIVVES
ncbi:MAG: MCE family protein, partial [Phycisphaeraceae bacterium]|nr:MCE family protein [Phycisphaeraceae bacterium]